MTKSPLPFFLAAGVAVLLLVACAVRPAPGVTEEPTPAPQLAQENSTATRPPATRPPATPSPLPSATASATASATPVPSATPTSSLTPTPTQTFTPSPTPTPTHPLMIEVMRRQSYPGSELTVEATLTWGPGYERFIVSYLSEGNKIYALLTVPRGEKPASGWPVIIFNHGYIPPDVYRTTESYENHVKAFAQNGYIVFRSDYRGHHRSEGEPTGGYGSPAYTIDVLNGLAAVKTFPDADPDRIGMWGHSMGGHITLRSMVITGDVKAGVIWAGVVGSYPDLLQRWRRAGPTRTPDPSRTRASWRWELAETYGPPQENPAFWAAISPNTYVSDLSGPIQIHHGTADTSVPYEFSETLAAQIEAAGLPVELYIYEGDDHNLVYNWGTAMVRTIEFFNRYVKGSG
ncbi:MAG: alpha/beta fold hydrolase [Candidatus Promineifilaceae bacterium]|nr:alpha/beta fold hydrolase [Candidatus Promineifilaceae bacterium]